LRGRVAVRGIQGAHISIMLVDAPAEIPRSRFVYRGPYRRQVRRDVVLEAALADVAQQFLKTRNPHHTRAAERP
jgi:hypothetical protein